MSISTDSWAVSPAAANATFYFGAAAVAGAGALTLAATTPSVNGCGYQMTLGSVGDSSGMTYTIVGYTVGNPTRPVTEVIAGANATTVTTVNYWSSIVSITASAAATGNQSIGFAAVLAIPRTRIRCVHYVGAAAAGSIVVSDPGTSKVLLNVGTPASTAFAGHVDAHNLAAYCASATDAAIVTLTQVTVCTLICG